MEKFYQKYVKYIRLESVSLTSGGLYYEEEVSGPDLGPRHFLNINTEIF